MKAMGISDVLNFDFMDIPDRYTMIQSLKSLYLLNWLDSDGRITDDGKQMWELPLEPTYGKCLLAATKPEYGNCLQDMIILVWLLSSESIFYRPSKQHPENV